MVSAKEFRSWLFPQNIGAVVKAGEDGSVSEGSIVMNILMEVLREQFGSNTTSLFEYLDT